MLKLEKDLSTDLKEIPFVGASRSNNCVRTISVISNKLKALSSLKGAILLDVGCGDGSFTLALSEGFTDVYAIDVQKENIFSFRSKVSGDNRFKISEMSASQMNFPDNYFDTILSIETIEHIPELTKAIMEMYRVLKPGGELIITCPNRLFPFENHGIRLGKYEFHARIPLITYFPWLHNKISLARVFTLRGLNQLFLSAGFFHEETDYAWPTFEHGGNVFQPILKPLFSVMRIIEHSPFKMFGTSIIVRYVKRKNSVEIPDTIE